ncbi:hypothetical protein [Pelosinus sp. IPA-1]|uniref:hypothetical protein n=1 Tax=Pelosinus sp. IPA-1 TaxID=3029569 RepID=UPI0024362A36|nr:hypothetical protein [Pelosinus sp. IPA-1]GMA97762.1 hypothetical protein PIPA1_05620 [Pelosinus sp. IPA-1]
MKKIPMCFPVVAQDAINYLIGKHLANSQISCVLRLKGRINETMLKQAVRLSLDVEPILGCRLIENDNNPVWELRDDLDEIELCSVIETDSVDVELQKFIGARYEFVSDCQLKVRVLRAESDIICVKINHACSDAGGLKQYLNLLISIYDLLFKGQQYVVQFRSSYSRGQDQILRIPNAANIVGEIAKTGVNPSRPTVAFPCNPGENKEQAFILKKLYPVDKIADYARKNDATVNDVLLTAFNRALPKMAKIENKTISVYITMDLRRYLIDHKTEAICNLSAMLPVMISNDSTESFEATLSKLVIETRKLKSNNSGIKSAYLLEMAHAKLSFKDGSIRFQQRRKQTSMNQLCIPTFSNVGIIAKETMKFGLLEVAECYIVGPAAFSPDFGMVASTYENTMTLAVNFFQSTMQKETIEQFIDAILNELPIH